MRTRSLGTSGLVVSEIGLGCTAMSQNSVRPLNMDEMIFVIRSISGNGGMRSPFR